jgi:prepilin-type N-terminal cleavage/methylation domain-containing protein/prepilin-type processing-associated H-X9-DG protein
MRPFRKRTSPVSAGGFTLIELLVVISVIGILIALLLPAVQKVREAANRMQCQNNLKQLALGLFGFQENKKRFPISDDGNTAGMQETSTGNQPSWLLVTLPYLEQDNAYRLLTALSSDSAIAGSGVNRPPYFRCPSDPYAPTDKFATNYAGSLGPQQVEQFCGSPPGSYPTPFSQYATPDTSFPGDPTWGYTTSGAFDNWGADPPLSGNRGVIIWSHTVGVRLADVTDGTSNTILIGEYEPKYDERFPGTSTTSTTSVYGGGFGSWTGAHLGVSTIIPINWPIDDTVSCGYNNWGGSQPLATGAQQNNAHDNFSVSNGFRSKHPGGANFAFVDGSVHFLTQNIDHKTYQHLGCRNDNQPLGDY